MVVSRGGSPFERALVVRDLRTDHVHRIALPGGVAVGTPPELVLNWSPDGTRVAVFDGQRIRLVDVTRAHAVQSQPRIAEPPSRVSHAPFLAPVYLARTIWWSTRTAASSDSV